MCAAAPPAAVNLIEMCIHSHQALGACAAHTRAPAAKVESIRNRKQIFFLKTHHFRLYSLHFAFFPALTPLSRAPDCLRFSEESAPSSRSGDSKLKNVLDFIGSPAFRIEFTSREAEGAPRAKRENELRNSTALEISECVPINV